MYILLLKYFHKIGYLWELETDTNDTLTRKEDQKMVAKKTEVKAVVVKKAPAKKVVAKKVVAKKK